MEHSLRDTQQKKRPSKHEVLLSVGGSDVVMMRRVNDDSAIEDYEHIKFKVDVFIV